MKLSLIIPTRSRAEYLGHSLASVLVARDRARCDVEIIVSDNQSDDDTADLLASFEAEGVKYLRTPARFSMRRNFEHGLAAATGTHCLFIGDDDAVLPSGLFHLAQIIGETGAEVVNWAVPNYIWPDPARDGAPFLEIRPLKLSGRVEKRNPAQQLSKIMAGRFRSYYSGGVIYHGCVAQSLIQRARASGEGTYFWTATPDVFAAMRNVMLARTDLVSVHTPLTLGGASPRSNGATWKRYSSGDANSKLLEFARFVQESKDDDHNGLLPSDCASLALLTLDALLLSLRLNGRAPEIDRAAWRTKVESELLGLPEPTADRNRSYLEHLLTDTAGLSFPKMEPVSFCGASEAGAVGKRPRKGNLTRIPLVGSEHMKTVQTAAETLEEICGITNGPATAHFPFGTIRHVAGVMRRSRAIAHARDGKV